METKDKKRLALIIIGVAFLICVVAFATYAYFSVPIQNEFSETKINGTIEDIGNVSLLPEVNELALNLKASDMMLKEDSIAYYGTKEGTTEVESTEVIAKASVTGPGIFNCTYDLIMNATGTNNMYEAVQSMSTKEGNVILTVNGVRYDFGDSNLFPKTIKGEIKGLTEGFSQDITAQIRLVNRKDITQDELKGTDIEITFTMENFKCEAIEMGSAGAYVMKTSPANISEDLVEGLYRFQGSKEEVDNNYICFGTSDKDECSNTNTLYKYRIVGITPDGQLKIISSVPVEKYEWNNVNANISWPYSTLYYRLQSSANYYGADWSNLLLNKEWKYGKMLETDISEFTEETPIEEYYGIEKKLNNTINAKVGLLNLTDMYLHDTCYSLFIDIPNCNNGWLLPVDSEWQMDTYRAAGNSVDSAMYFRSDGLPSYLNMKPAIAYDNLKYRTVGYLDANLTLSGTGTNNDPYIINLEN